MKKVKNPLTDKFHIHYENKRLWEGTKWLGVSTWKLPFDAWIIQELIYRIRPDYIIETGTALGGSALFYASIQDLIGYGKVITIDIERKIEYKHDRVIFLEGSSVDKKIIEQVTQIAGGHDNMVILDSWHCAPHVLKELKAYAWLVGLYNYLIVEDTHVNGNPVPWKWGPGPMEAVQKFLKKTDEFEIDKDCERLGMTFNPNGYLRRVRWWV